MGECIIMIEDSEKCSKTFNFMRLIKMETIPENCIFYRSNICGKFAGFRSKNHTYRIEYLPSGMFAGRGLTSIILNDLRSDQISSACDNLKLSLIKQFNTNKLG